MVASGYRTIKLGGEASSMKIYLHAKVVYTLSLSLCLYNNVCSLLSHMHLNPVYVPRARSPMLPSNAGYT